MRIGEGVEWAAHACALLAGLPEGAGLPAAAIAEFHAVPPAYMAKHMQALARAGLVTSTRGAAGGYRLAKAVDDITLWDIAAALEGDEKAFRCAEIRQRGPCAAKREDCLHACTIAQGFWAAEAAYREQLQAVTLAHVISAILAKPDPERLAKLQAWLGEKANG